MRTVHVAAGIIYRDEKILAAHRSSEKPPQGWEFPGGKVEPEESAEEALRREIKEELGCSLELVWHYDTIEYDYPDFHLIMDCFICTLGAHEEPAMQPGIHDELRWLAHHELLDVDWLPADTNLIQGIGTFWDMVFEAQHL